MMVKEQMLPFLTTNSGHCMSDKESCETNSELGFSSNSASSQRISNRSRETTIPSENCSCEVDQSVKQKQPVGPKKQVIPKELCILVDITEALWEVCDCRPLVAKPQCTGASNLLCTESPKRPPAVEVTSKTQQNAVVNPSPADCMLSLQSRSPPALVVTRDQFLEMRIRTGVIASGTAEQPKMPHLHTTPLVWQKDSAKQTGKKKAGEAKTNAGMNCIATTEQSKTLLRSDAKCIEDEITPNMGLVGCKPEEAQKQWLGKWTSATPAVEELPPLSDADHSDFEDGCDTEDEEGLEVIVGPTHHASMPYDLQSLWLPRRDTSRLTMTRAPLKSSPRVLAMSDTILLTNARRSGAPLSFGSVLHLVHGNGEQCRPCMFERWAGRCNKKWLCDFCHLHPSSKKSSAN